MDTPYLVYPDFSLGPIKELVELIRSGSVDDQIPQAANRAYHCAGMLLAMYPGQPTEPIGLLIASPAMADDIRAALHELNAALETEFGAGSTGVRIGIPPWVPLLLALLQKLLELLSK